MAGLWFLSGGMVVAFVSLVALRWFFPLPIEHSAPQIVHRPGSIAVELELRSHLTKPSGGTLRVVLIHMNGGRGSHLTPLDHRDVFFVLQPGQTQQVRCDFPDHYDTFPNFAEAALLP